MSQPKAKEFGLVTGSFEFNVNQTERTTTRSELETERDRAYAKYWLEEYGTDPDPIREAYIFPRLRQLVGNYAQGGKVYDFGCGTGSIIPELKKWGMEKYVGIDVNRDFLNVAEKNFGSPQATFCRRNFDSPKWDRGLDGGFDLGISVFVLNELNYPSTYLSGIRRLCKKRGHSSGVMRKREKKGKSGQSRLALVLTHPVLVLKDLVDFYVLRTNARKFDEVESYRNKEQGRYIFSRGDFSIPYTHWPMADIFKMILECGWEIDNVSELHYNYPAPTQGIERDHLSVQFPKVLIVILRGYPN